MQKNYLPTAITLALGAVAAVLRKYEIENILSADGGLPAKGTAVSVLLVMISVIALDFAVVCAFLLTRNEIKPLRYSSAFLSRGVLASVVAAAAGVAIVVAAFMLDSDIGLSRSGLTFAVFKCFAILTGLSYISLAAAQAFGRDSAILYLTGVIPAMFYCMYLAVYYKNNAGNPSLREYMYGILALSSMAVAAYYSAGFIYSRQNPRAAVAFNLAALYFAVLTVSEPRSGALKLLSWANIVFLAVCSARLCYGLPKAASLPPENPDGN